MDGAHKERLEYLEAKEERSETEEMELAGLREHKAQTESANGKGKPAEVGKGNENVSEQANPVATGEETPASDKGASEDSKAKGKK